MSESFLPEIDIRLGPRNQQPTSIHSFPSNSKKHKLKNSKYDLIKQSILSPIATPLHQLVRVSLSNKTVVFKKRLLTQQRSEKERENLAPMQCHQTNKIFIMKQSPRLLSEPSGQLRACKSFLNAKMRQRRVSMELPKKMSLLERARHQKTESLYELTQNPRLKCPERKEGEEFQLTPWENQEGVNGHGRGEEPKRQHYLELIKRCL